MLRRIAQAALVLVLALLPFTVSGQSVVTGSGFQVQNLNDAQAANIVITYYTTTGSVAATQNQAIPAGAAITFYDGQNGSVAMSAPSGFRGSVVISSDQPIAAITNLTGSSLGEAYSGFSNGSGTVSVPLIQRGNSGFNSTLTVQNTGSAATTVTVAYTPGLSGNAGVTDTASIPAGASVTFDQAAKSELGALFVGSATATAGSGGSIVAIVNQTAGSQLLAYNAFTAGAPKISVPLLQANNSGYYSGLQIQNAGQQTTNVTVTYAANVATGSNACTLPTAQTFSLAAGASKTLIQAGGDAAQGFNPEFATCRYIGAATIASDNSQPLVGIVNQLGGGSSSSYESFSNANATGIVKAPLVAANNSGYTAIQVQNVGSASTNVTVNYSANSATGAGVCATPTAVSHTINAGASFTFFQAAGGSVDEGFDTQFATCRYVGSATITAASGGQIVAVVNQLVIGFNDGLFSYNGFNQ